MFQANLEKKNTFYVKQLFSPPENCAVYEMMQKNAAQPDTTI